LRSCQLRDKQRLAATKSMRRTAVSPASRGSPEGRFLAGPGKPAYHHLSDLQGREADLAAKVKESQDAMEHAERANDERTDNHRGGGRIWLMRLLIPVAIVAEAVTAYVAMEALVASQLLAIGLSLLASLVGAGMACVLANRRLNRLPVPTAARVLEGIFVAVVTVLRYASLHIQGADVLTAVGAALLAALISALGLLGIEEIVVETRTFGIFISTLQASWTRWRCAVAKARLARIRARIKAMADSLQQHFLDFLLKVEGFPLDEARRRSGALKAALTHGEADDEVP
jgi:hypothetical protein